jgi:hypothetical protein
VRPCRVVSNKSKPPYPHNSSLRLHEPRVVFAYNRRRHSAAMQPFQGFPASASNQAPDSQSSTFNASNHVRDSSSADNRVVRSIPPWVHTEDDSDDESIDQTQRLLLLANAVPASHHYLPAPPTQHKAPGRKWDHIRSAEPPLLDQPIDTNQQRWLPYMLSGPQPRGVPGARLVSDAWMDENMPHLASTWTAVEPEKPSEKPKGLWLFTAERRSKTFTRISVCIHVSMFLGCLLIFVAAHHPQESFRPTCLPSYCAYLHSGRSWIRCQGVPRGQRSQPPG